MVCWYEAYKHEQSADDQGRYEAAEVEARQSVQALTPSPEISRPNQITQILSFRKDALHGGTPSITARSYPVKQRQKMTLALWVAQHIGQDFGRLSVGQAID